MVVYPSPDEDQFGDRNARFSRLMPFREALGYARIFSAVAIVKARGIGKGLCISMNNGKIRGFRIWG